MSRTIMYTFVCGCELSEELNYLGEYLPRFDPCDKHLSSVYIHPEDHIEQMFRQHILRNWYRERTIKFCLHLLGDETSKWWRSHSKEAAEHRVVPDQEPAGENSDDGC